MDLEMRHIRCFVAVAKEGSFTRAASRLHMSQPALSVQIKDLEKRIGFLLLERSTRSVSLTDEGAALLEAAEQLIHESDTFKTRVNALREQRHGILHIGAAYYTIDIPERVAIFESFMARYPSADIDVQTKWQGELLEAVMAKRLDAAMVIGRAVGKEDGEKARRGELIIPSEMKRIKLRSKRIQLLIPKEMPMAGCAEVRPSDLCGIRVALIGPYHGEAIIGPLRDLLRSAGAEPFTPPEGNTVAVERFGRQFRLPAMSIGWFGRDPRLHDMVSLPIEGFYDETELSLVTNSDFEKPLIRRLWDFVSGWTQDEAKHDELRAREA